MTRAKWMTAVLLAGMFLSGGICGAAVMRLVVDREATEMMRASPAEARRNLRLRAMARQLGLSAEQKAKSREILRKYREKCAPLERDVAEQRRECEQQARDEMLDVLTPAQRRKYERIMQNRGQQGGRRQRQQYRGGRP